MDNTIKELETKISEISKKIADLEKKVNMHYPDWLYTQHKKIWKNPWIIIGFLLILFPFIVLLGFYFG